MCLLFRLFLFLFSLFSLILLHFLRFLLFSVSLLLHLLFAFAHFLLNRLRLLFITYPTTLTVQIRISNSVIIMPSKKPMPTSMPQMIRE